MKKYLLLGLVFLGLCAKVFALDIVYPKTNPAKINASGSFFIGSASPDKVLKINDVEIPVAPNGAFAQSILLYPGTNYFKIISGDKSIDFYINREKQKGSCTKNQKLIAYPMMTFYVKDDNAPLRLTPVSGGINRLAHLDEGTKLLINCEKGNFYRVYLNSKLYGWIAKSEVNQATTEDKDYFADISKTIQKEDNDFCIYEFNLNKKVPFVLKEENGLFLQIFNVIGFDNNTYCLNIPTQKLMGYDINYDGTNLILKVRKIPEINPEKPLKNIIIAIDAGHGGNEKGAIGCCGEKEKDINLAIAKNLKEELEQRGAKVVMTRHNDTTVSLKERVKIAKEKDAHLLISIHANALPDGKDPIQNRGTSLYYYHNQAKPLAESILQSMTSQLGTNNDKVRQGSLALVRPTSSVSVLVEVAYMINPDDYTLLTDECFQLNCAKAIADGIEKYILIN